MVVAVDEDVVAHRAAVGVVTGPAERLAAAAAATAAVVASVAVASAAAVAVAVAVARADAVCRDQRRIGKRFMGLW